MELLIAIGYVVIPAAAMIASFAFSGDADSAGGDGMIVGCLLDGGATLATHDVVLAVARAQEALGRDEPRTVSGIPEGRQLQVRRKLLLGFGS